MSLAAKIQVIVRKAILLRGPSCLLVDLVRSQRGRGPHIAIGSNNRR